MTEAKRHVSPMTAPVCACCERPMHVVVIRHGNGRVVPHPICPTCLTGRVRTPDWSALRLVTR